ncbi:MAG: Ig-like domain-containing protein [Sandaracinaceae bacterium]
MLAGATPGCDLPIEANPTAGPAVLASDPADGDPDVERSGAYTVWFDRPILPRDVHRGRVMVASGGRGVFLSPVFDPVERSLHLVNLGSPLDPEVRYRLRVSGIRDLDGFVMAEPYEIAFDTGTAIQETAPAAVAYADVEPILATCAAEGCHRPPDAVLGLDLSSPAGIRDTAINVLAEQTRVGTQSGALYRSVTGLRGLARLDVTGGVGRPSRSYLLYKVIGDPHVVGDRMPPGPAPALDAAALSLLSRWIFQGASTD